MIMRKKKIAILFLGVAALLLAALTFCLSAPTVAHASRSNQGTNTDTEWSGSQTTGNLITIGKGSLTEQGWNNINDQIYSQGRYYNEKGVDLKTEAYGWGIQAQNPSDDIGNKSYENGVWYRITLSDADKVKAAKGDLTVSASSLNYRQDATTHYVSLKLFFDNASGTQLESEEQKKEITKSAYQLSISNRAVPKNTASIRYYVSNWGSLTARPFIGGLICTLTDTTAPTVSKISSNKSGITDVTNNVAIANDVLKYYLELDEKVSVSSYGTAKLALDGTVTSATGSSSLVTENGKSKICYTFTLPELNKSGKLSLYSVTGLTVKDEAGNELTYTKSSLSSGSVQYYKKMTVSSTLTNLSFSGKSEASYGTDYTATLKTNTGYNLPQSIAFKVGGVTKTAGYTYNKTSGLITVKGTYITGDLSFVASGVAKQSAVTFDMQKGSGGTLSATATYNAGMPKITVPSRTGYTFRGYYSKVNGLGTQYYSSTGASARNCDFYAATTLYAYWTANGYTIKYDKNKPATASETITGSTSDSSHTYDAAKSLNVNGYALKGWTFRGWATTTNGAVVYENKESVVNLSAVNGATVTLYAVWKANVYFVEYDKNKPATASGTVTGSTTRSSHSYDSYGALSENGFALKGWTFQGWAHDSGAKTADYRGGEKVTNLAYETDSSVKLYAVWKANSYKLKYAANQPAGASGAVGGNIAETTHVYDQTSVLPANEFSLVGWTFRGWAFIPNSAETDFADGAAAYNVADAEGAVVTLYAVWKANEYTITYEANAPATASGTITGSTNVSSHTYDAEKSLNENGYGLRGWTFLGWAKTANGAALYEDTQNVVNLSTVNGATVTLYAVWKANTYSISFDTVGGSFTEAISAVYDSDIPSLIAPTRKGYNFNGYYAERDGNGTKFFESDGNALLKYTVLGNIRLYAYWTPVNYDIQLYSQGKYVATINNVVFGSMRLPSAEELNLKRDNYDFVGWNLYDDQNWAMYYADTDYNTGIADVEGETVIIYAAWMEKPVFTINFDANGGIGAPAMAQAHKDETITLSSVIPSRKNYSFLGWATETDAASALYTPGDEFTMDNAVVTFYAVWKLNPCLSYDANGGAFSVPAERVYPVAGQKTALTDLVPERVGYVFRGWSVDKEATDAEFVSGQEIVMPSKDTVLYAVWKTAQYVVLVSASNGYSVIGLSDYYVYDEVATFEVIGNRPKVYVNGQRLTEENGVYSFIVKGDSRVLVADGSKLSLIYSANGGANAPTDDTSYNANSSTTVSDAKPKRVGYRFSGWSTDPSAVSAEYTANQSLAFEEDDVILYAVWQANSYTVTYDNGGGEGTMPVDTFRYGEQGALSLNAFTKTGHLFIGWAISENGEAVYADGVAVSDLCSENGDNFTLYAVWQRAVTVITFVTNDGTEFNAPLSVTYGEELSSDNLVVPVRSGYIFAGYFTEQNGAGELIFDDKLNVAYVGAWDKTVGNLTIYSYWIPVSYAVVYVNGQNEAGRQFAVYGQSFALLSASSLGVIAPQGYRFAGWSTVPSGQTVVYEDELTINEPLTKVNDDEVFLYAVFEANEKFSIIYNANGGTNAPVDNNKYFEGEVITFGNTIPEREGYKFGGYSYDTSGNADFAYSETDGFTPQSVTMQDGGLTLYAVWVLDGKTLKEQIKEINAVNSSLSSAIASLDATNTSFSTKIESLDAEIKSAQNLLAGLDDTYVTKTELADKIAELNALLAQAKKELSDKIDGVQSNLEQAVKDLNATISGDKQELVKRLDDVEQAYKNLNDFANTKFTSLQDKDTELSNKIVELERVRKEADDKLSETIDGVKADLTNAVNTLNKTISSNKTDIEAKLAEVGNTYQTLNTFVNSNLATLQDKDAELSNKIAELEKVRKETDDKLAKTIDEVQSNLEQAVSSLNETISSNKDDIETKLAAVERASQNADAILRLDLAALTKSNESLAERVTALENSSEKGHDAIWAGIVLVQKRLDEAKSRLNEKDGELEKKIGVIQAENDRIAIVCTATVVASVLAIILTIFFAFYAIRKNRR